MSKLPFFEVCIEANVRMPKNRRLWCSLFVFILSAFVVFGDKPAESAHDVGFVRLKMERSTQYKDRMEALRKAIVTDRERMHRMLFMGGRRSLLHETLNVISGSSVGSGEYLVSMSIGTPPQNVYLIADTGSDLTWVKCSQGRARVKAGFGISGCCDRFSHPCSPSATNYSFIPSNSSSFRPLSCHSSQCAAWFFPPTCDRLLRNCKFSYSYTDSSYAAGSVAYETITLGPSSKVEVLLGCGDGYEGQNFAKAGGVIGLGLGPMSLASQLADQKGLPLSPSSSPTASPTALPSSSTSYANVFSYCLADFFGPSSMSGSLAFGEPLAQIAVQLQYTPLIWNPMLDAYYYVGVQEVRLGESTLDIPADVWQIDAQGFGGTILDSGTTLAQFLQPAYDVIHDAFQEAISYPQFPSVAGLDLCYNVSAESAHFPAFAILFQWNLLFQPPQENYFMEAAPGITCLAMQSVPTPGFSVIGNLLQQNYNIEFDRLHNRLGLAPTDCSKLH